MLRGKLNYVFFFGEIELLKSWYDNSIATSNIYSLASEWLILWKVVLTFSVPQWEICSRQITTMGKNYNMLQESGKNYNNMRTQNIILQGHEQKLKPLKTISCHLDWTSLVNNAFINYMTKNKCFLAGHSRQDGFIVPEQPSKTEDSLYLASLRIYIHITKIDIAFCCPECMCHWQLFFKSSRDIPV